MSTLVLTRLALIAALLLLLLHYARERQQIKRYALAVTRGQQRPLGAALELAGAIYSQLPRGKDPAFLSLQWPPSLGATPVAVLRRGGCCSGLCRLYITSLNSLGIQAAQVSLYHVSGMGRHCLVEVWLPGGPVLVDPTYGFYYVDSGDGLLGFDALRSGARPGFRALPGSSSEGYKKDDYYDFDYRISKTANWTMTGLRRISYRFLAAVTHGRVDAIRQPVLLEWPQLVIASPTAALLLLTFVGV